MEAIALFFLFSFLSFLFSSMEVVPHRARDSGALDTFFFVVSTGPVIFLFLPPLTKQKGIFAPKKPVSAPQMTASLFLRMESFITPPSFIAPQSLPCVGECFGPHPAPLFGFPPLVP